MKLHIPIILIRAGWLILVVSSLLAVKTPFEITVLALLFLIATATESVPDDPEMKMANYIAGASAIASNAICLGFIIYALVLHYIFNL